MLAKGELPLSRVDAICRALKIDFAELARRVADKKLPEKDREGYTLLLALRSWEFKAFSAMRR